MRTKLVAVFGSLAVLIAFAASSATGASKPKPKAKTVSCTYDVTTQGSGTGTTGKDLGYVKCGKPFGNGLQSDSFTNTVSGTTVKISGPVKDFFDTGTVHGTYSISGSTTGTTFKGSATLSGGTGAFKHLKGSTKNLTCTPSSPTQNHCTATISYTIG